MRSVHDGHPDFRCGECGSQLSSTTSLLRHILISHPNLPHEEISAHDDSSDETDMLNISPEKELAMTSATFDENGYVPLYEDDEDDSYSSINLSGNENHIQQLEFKLTLVSALIELCQNPFFLYAQNFHAEFSSNLPENSSDSNVNKELSRRWIELSDGEKSKYVDQATKNKIEHGNHMEANFN